MIEDFDRDLFKKCMPYFDKPPVIFDVGAHEGLYTKFVLETIPEADCYLFEPNRELSAKLSSYKNAFELAIAESSGYRAFYKCPQTNNELSSLYPREIFNETGFEKILVQFASIDIFCLDIKIPKIDFIKVDVEGAELDVLNGCPSMMRNKQIKFIQIEYGGTYIDAGIKFTQVIQTANLFGYRVYELIKNNLVEVTEENFIEDYRYGVFLLTYLPCL